MNKYLLAVCRNLVLISTLLTASSVFSAVNEHPIFKLKPNKELENLKPKSTSQIQLSRAGKTPSLDELHYEEKHPHNDAILIKASSFDPSKLLPSKVISLDSTKPNLKLPDPQINIAGRNYILSIVESVADPKERVRYVTATIVGHNGRARFIIDDASGELVGNLIIEGDTFRVIPRELNKEQQLIYKLKKISPENHRRIKTRIISKVENKSVHRLERELLKTELLSVIKPTVLRQPSKISGGRTKLIGGSIGQIDVQKLVANRDISVIEEFLTDIEILTNSSSQVKYKITKIVGSQKRGYSVNFQQLINGLPLRSSSRIRFDGKGNITEISNLVLKSDLLEIKQSKFSEAEVLEIAKKAARDYVGKPNLTFITLDRTPINVGYKITDSKHTLIPYWEVILYEVEAGAGSYRIFIEGHSGKAKVSLTADHVTTQIQTDVCEHESGIPLPGCQDINIVIPIYPPITILSTVREIISESTAGQFICEYSGLCQDPQAKHPWEVINNMEDWLSENTDGICCSEVGGISDSIDVKINTLETGGPSFDIASGTASFPHPSSLDPTIFNPVQSQTIDDAVVHEVTHGVIHGVNSDLSEAIIDEDPWATALNEGLSDAMAVLYSEEFAPPGDTKVAEDLFKNPGDVRDISQSKTFDDFVDSTAAGMAQQNGKIFSNMIYRLRQNGLSINQAAKVIIWIADTVDRDGGLIEDKLDEKDIKEAVDTISAIDQVIGAILDIVWNEMNGYEDPPSGGSGTPASPSFVTGFFTGCYNNSVSLYSNSWGSSSGASLYQVFYSPTGGGYIYAFSTSFPGATTANTIDAFVKIKACNVNGCSALSNSTFFQPHLCGG